MVVEVNTKTGPSSPPHVVSTLAAVLNVFTKDFDDITSLTAGAVWDELRASLWEALASS